MKLLPPVTAYRQGNKPKLKFHFEKPGYSGKSFVYTCCGYMLHYDSIGGVESLLVSDMAPREICLQCLGAMTAED